MEKAKCIICGKEINPQGFALAGNNPDPVYPLEAGRCCDECNAQYVIPARHAVAEIIRSAIEADRRDNDDNI